MVVVLIGSFSKHFRVSLDSYGSPGETSTWYCAGEAVNAKADPYRVEPLRSCEARHAAGGGYPWVEPAPLPGYVLGGFALLARLPYELAEKLLLYALIAAVVLTAGLLANLTRAPIVLTLLCLSLIDGYVDITFRELPSLAIAALVSSAVLGASQRYAAAAACAALAMIEPHIGLPACIAIFAWWPRTRVPLVIAGLGLGLVSVIAIGMPANIEYFREVLPAHAASEIAAMDQYSLTWVLHVLGMSDANALRLGSLSYIVTTLLGVALCRRLATAAESEALIVLFPPAMAVFGGAFVHDIQIAAAVPAAIVLAVWTRPPILLRMFALAAVVFTWHAASWSQSLQTVVLAATSVVAAVLLAMRDRPIATRWTSAVTVAIVWAGLSLGMQRLPQRTLGPPTHIARFAVTPSDDASENWAARITRDASYTTPNVREVAAKLPLWLGLLALASIGIIYSRPGRRRSVPTLAVANPQECLRA